MDGANVIQIVNLFLNMAILPGIAVLWKLANSIKDLKFTLYTEFVTKEALEARLLHERQVADRDCQKHRKETQDHNEAFRRKWGNPASNSNAQENAAEG